MFDATDNNAKASPLPNKLGCIIPCTHTNTQNDFVNLKQRLNVEAEMRSLSVCVPACQ